MPVKKPVITALEMKRVSVPSFRSPSASWMRPTRMVNVTSSCAWLVSPAPATTPATTNIMALVQAQFMNWDPVKTPATGMPTIMALKA